MAGVEKITQLESAHRNFYAPTARVVVKNEDLLVDKGMEIVSVQVDNALNKADQFSFVINNGFDVENREFSTLLEFFEFGAPVEIFMGYVNRKDMPLMVVGLVTSVTTSFPAQGLPQITVTGFDHSYCLMKRNDSQSWNDITDSQVVQNIAKIHKLDAIVDDTKTKKPKVEKNQENDYQFIEKLAVRNGYEFYVAEKTIHFEKPDNDTSGAFELEWGAGLVSFAPELNIVEQITEVEVRGWNPQNKKEYVGKARVGDEPGRDKKKLSGGEYAAQICKDSKIQVRRAVSSQQEADQWAKAILKARAEGFVKGSGQSIGIPALRAGQNLTLKGVGERFSKDYFLDQCTHTVNTQGYKTTFKVKDTTI